MSSLRALLAGTVDYAGLFPPAGLDLPTVVANYRRYLDSDWNWMLGRLIVPAAQLEALEGAAGEFWKERPPWRISALVPGPAAGVEGVEAAWDAISQFNARHGGQTTGGAIVDAIETRASSPADIDWLGDNLPTGWVAFVEFDGLDPETGIAQLAGQEDAFGRSPLFAKIRTGGMEQAMIPDASTVAAFLIACGQQLVPLKATAGLHHPLRGEFPLSYADDAPCGTMHGYLNVFVAGALAFHGVTDASLLEEVLATDRADAFSFRPDALEWNGHSIPTARIRAFRRRFLFSFGSCSFEEPTSELPYEAATAAAG